MFHMDKGIEPLRRFSERSKNINFGIRFLISDGIGPTNKLLLRESLDTLVNQNGIGPLKQL